MVQRAQNVYWETKGANEQLNGRCRTNRMVVTNKPETA